MILLYPTWKPSETSREDNVVESLKHFMEIHWEHLNSGYRPKVRI